MPTKSDQLRKQLAARRQAHREQEAALQKQLAAAEKTERRKHEKHVREVVMTAAKKAGLLAAFQRAGTIDAEMLAHQFSLIAERFGAVVETTEEEVDPEARRRWAGAHR